MHLDFRAVLRLLRTVLLTTVGLLVANCAQATSSNTSLAEEAGAPPAKRRKIYDNTYVHGSGLGQNSVVVEADSLTPPSSPAQLTSETSEVEPDSPSQKLTEMPTQSFLCALPDEILLRLSVFLNPFEQVNLAETCWRIAVLKSDFLKRTTFSGNPDEFEARLNNDFLYNGTLWHTCVQGNSARNLLDLNLGQKWSLMTSALRLQGLQVTCTNARFKNYGKSAVTKLWLNNVMISNEGLADLFERLPHLKALSMRKIKLSQQQDARDIDILMRIGEHLPKSLATLEIGDTRLGQGKISATDFEDLEASLIEVNQISNLRILSDPTLLNPHGRGKHPRNLLKTLVSAMPRLIVITLEDCNITKKQVEWATHFLGEIIIR